MKQEDLKIRLCIIRQIHRQKIGEQVDVSDIKRTILPKPSEIFSEKECWKCGKVQKRNLCAECKQELKETSKVIKPEIDTIPEVNIETVFVEFLKNRSLYDLFTREMILGGRIKEVSYMQSFMLFIKDGIKVDHFEKVMLPGNIKYRLTSKGVAYFSEKIYV